MSLRFGYWLPVFGGWLRNVEDEGMPATWEYVRDLAVRSEKIGFDLTLIAELNLNDIKGVEAPSLDAWSTAAALAAMTRRLELMVAVRPNFHHPGLLAKQAANIDRIAAGRLSLNVVSSWWKDEAVQYGLPFDEHDARYLRTEEWLKVVKGLWSERRFSFVGRHYRFENAVLEPKPRRSPRPLLYAGGESEAAKNLIASQGDAYLMHGDPPERIAARIADMRRRRERLAPGEPPLVFGAAAFAICRESEEAARRERARITDVRSSARGYANFNQWLSGTRLEQPLSLEDYSVSNRGLRSGLVGTAERLAGELHRFQEAGVNLMLLQFSPQAEEMERFAAEVMTRFGPACGLPGNAEELPPGSRESVESGGSI
jgi:FMNH2-dependent dimethyl sulfone monooxygenase